MQRLGLAGQPQRQWRERFEKKRVTAAQVKDLVRPGDRIFIASNCGVPETLIKALVESSDDLADCEIISLLTRGEAPYVDQRFHDRFRHNAFFIGANVRDAVNAGHADYTPVFLSEVPGLFKSGKVPIDVAMIMVSPPDQHGFCSLGIAVDVSMAAAASAKKVIAQVNPAMPRTHGDSCIHIDQLTAAVEHESPMLEFPPGELDDVSLAIGRHVASIVPDGATIQAGIGKIPDSVMAALAGKKDLGVHTEMFSDGVVDLVDAGVITGRRKTLHAGKIVASFAMGTNKLYQFVHDNPLCEFHPTEYVNDPFLISQHDNMVAVNAAIEIDLTGQVCSDSIGTRFFSGIGGQVDFIRGAARSRNGRPIICLPSTAADGQVSRIVSFLKPGAGVVTSRGDVHFVATEWGIVDLHGRTARERALALIQLAHPDYRKELFNAAKLRGLLDQGQPEPRDNELPATDLELRQTLANEVEVHIRPAQLTDERALQEMWYDLTENTVLRMSPTEHKTLPRQRVREMLTFDARRDLALVATVLLETGRERIVGIGRYATDRSTGYAELGILLHDDFQGLGLGKAFMAVLARHARRQGVRGLTGAVAIGNYSALELFQSYGVPIEVTSDGTMLQLKLTFGEHLPQSGG